MSLYPSLEDMKMDQMITAQAQMYQAAQAPSYAQIEQNKMPEVAASAPNLALYPALGEYMGLELGSAVVAANMPEYALQIPVVQAGANKQLLAPLSGQSVGLQRAQVTNGIRQLTLCKDKDGKVGLRVAKIDNGVFVNLVIAKSPAALAGLRFGDQILQINNEDMAGYNMEKVHGLLKKCGVNGINIVVRDRPFERTITLHKDSTNHIGCHFKDGKITSIVKDTSAARNGLLINHQILEVDGVNVIGLKDKEITKIIEGTGSVVTLTIIPSFVYEHMTKKMSSSLIKNLMDHSVLNI